MIAHVMGLPLEETAVQLAPAGAAMMTVAAIAAREGIRQLRRRLRLGPRGRDEC